MARPKLVKPADDADVYDFDHFVEQAEQVTKPYKLKLPVYETVKDDEGKDILDESTGEPQQRMVGHEVVEIGAPDTEQMRQVRTAQMTQDIDLLADAIFEVYAERVLDLVKGKDYLVINAMVRSVMDHYGRRLDELGES